MPIFCTLNSMKRVSYFFALSAAIVTAELSASAQFQTGYSALYDSEPVLHLKEEVGYIASAMMEGRAPGSEGETETAKYVWEKLKEYEVDLLCPEEGDIFGIAGADGDTLVSRNVIGFIQGHDKNLKDRYIVIGARMDNLGVNQMTVDGRKVDQIYYGANGNASGLAIMLELAGRLKTNEVLLRRSVLFVAFGSSTMTYAGAWYFLNRSFADIDRIDVMINLDMLGTADNGLYAYTASNTDLNAILTEVENELQPIKPQIVAEEPYPSDHRAFYSSEIPSIFLTSGRYPEHNTHKDTESILDYEMMEKVLEYAYNLSMTVSNTTKAMDFRPTEPKVKSEVYNDVVSVSDCDSRPQFLNSSDISQFMQKWVYAYLRYPESAIEEGVQGRVVVDFIIEKDGSVTNVRVVRGVDQRLDDEAVRVISASPKWRAGRVNGERVRTSMTVPVEFKLQSKSEKSSFGINGSKNLRRN